MRVRYLRLIRYLRDVFCAPRDLFCVAFFCTETPTTLRSVSRLYGKPDTPPYQEDDGMLECMEKGEEDHKQQDGNDQAKAIIRHEDEMVCSWLVVAV